MKIDALLIQSKIKSRIPLTQEEWDWLPEVWRIHAIKPGPMPTGLIAEEGGTVDERTRKVHEDMKAGKIKAPAKITQKPVPTVFTQQLNFEWFRQFSWLERLRICFGANLVVVIGIATQHRSGVTQPFIIGNVSHEHSATDHMRNVVADMLEEQRSKAPVVSEPEAKK